MKKIIYIFVFIIPFSAFAINQQEANAISEIIECKNTINDKAAKGTKKYKLMQKLFIPSLRRLIEFITLKIITGLKAFNSK